MATQRTECCVIGTVARRDSGETVAGEEGSPGLVNSFDVEAFSTDPNGAGNALSLGTRDQLGVASLILPRASAGLATDQPVFWNTPGASTFGFLSTSLNGAGVSQAMFTLETIAVAVPEPSHAALMLAGLVGVAGVAAQRRRSA